MDLVKDRHYWDVKHQLKPKQYSKTCLKQSLKIDRAKVLKTNGSLVKVERIAECSQGGPCLSVAVRINPF